jgi:hypothetical protein
MQKINLKNKMLQYYQLHERRVDLSFFLGGFVFDIFTLSEVNDPISIIQQILYLIIMGTILYFEYSRTDDFEPNNKLFKTLWNYKRLIFHFCLGSLISIYSIYFLISSSFFTSLVFVLLLLALLVANEIKFIQESKVNIKLCLYVIALFCFYSMMWPILLGFVGLTPFFLSIITTLATIIASYKLIIKKIIQPQELKKKFLIPSFGVIILFILFYFLGWIPPVPLSVQDMGIYHLIEKQNNQYILHHQNPWWRFWQKGDQNFIAEANDKIYFFAKISSPTGFNDKIILHWYNYHPKLGWQSTDKIPMNVRGGRSEGYRGFSVKQNYTEGEWRISVETTDNREIGRIYFNVKKVIENNIDRFFYQSIE